jgi:uncharacterized membrane protein
MTPISKEEAQRRADRIAAFRDELASLEAEGVAALTGDQKRAIAARHEAVLADLTARFDVDTTERLRQMSWGMRIASLLGAGALSAAIYFFFERIWGSLGAWAQIAILTASPLLAVAAAGYAARRERTRYFAAILGILALACFVLDLNLLGMTFNITPTQNALLAWGAFAVTLAYTLELRLLLAGGLLSLLGYMSATVATWGGYPWDAVGNRPENFLLPGLVLFAIGAAWRDRERSDFPPIYRFIGLLALLFPIFILANWGRSSYLPFDADPVEIIYQILGFSVSGVGIWIGVRSAWSGVANLASVFFVAFLIMKFYEWWWDVLPKYFFFLIVGLVAVGLIVILKRFRSLTMREAS